jgi:hypothetical protein
MARTKRVNDEVIAFTPEEEAVRDAEEAQAAIDKASDAVAKIAKKDRLASVKSKLEALGLTTEEVQDAFGI